MHDFNPPFKLQSTLLITKITQDQGENRIIQGGFEAMADTQYVHLCMLGI